MPRAKKPSRGMVMYLILLMFSSSSIYAVNQKIPDELKDVLDEICGQFSPEGSASGLGLTGEAKASLAGFLKKLISLDLLGDVEFDKTKYTGVLQKHLAGEFKSIRDCRMVIWQSFKTPIALVENPAEILDESLKVQQQQYNPKYSFVHPPFVHPLIVRDLIGWISDTGFQIDSINLLDAQNSNRYHGEIDTTDTDKIAGSPWVYSFDGVDNGKYGFGRTPFIAYKYLGTTESGLDVIHAKDSGGGSAIFHWILFLSVKADYGFEYSSLKRNQKGKFMAKPEIKKRELVRVIGRLSLGDRWEGSINVVGNDIVVRGRTLEERCLEGGMIHPKDSAELLFFMKLKCRRDIAVKSPAAIVYGTPLL